SEATVIHDVVMERCTVTGPMPLLHLKLRPDTPQTYYDIHIKDVVMRAGWVFDVSPWTQFFDLKGQPEPKSDVHDVTISGVTGSFDSLGWIKGNERSNMRDITLENVDAQLKKSTFEHRPIEGLTFKNVTVNGAPFSPK